MMQCKLALTTIIKNFILTVNEKTQDAPLLIDPNEALKNVKIGGFWINFEPIIKTLET